MLQIRPFCLQDQQAVIELWKSCGLLRAWNDPQLDILRKQSVGADLFLVAVQGDRIIGAVMGGYDGHRGWMNYLAVCPTAQRKGVGAELVESLEKRLVAVGCPKINLQIRHGNEAIMQFYLSLGYQDDQVLSMGKRLISDLQ